MHCQAVERHSSDGGRERTFIMVRSGEAAASSAIAHKMAGSMNHVDIRDMSFRESVAVGDLVLTMIPREWQVADVLTHCDGASS